MRRILVILAALALVTSVGASASASTPSQRTSATGRAASPASEERRFLCHEGDPLCAETADAIGYEGRYTGHDEPSVLYYSDKPGSGNNNRYRVVVPKDPPTLPTQDGTGGTFNFQNRIAFWFGMDLCDNQSAPEFTYEPARPTVTRISSTGPTRPSPTTSVAIPGRRSWSCSSTRPAGCRSRTRSAATPPSGARPWRSSASTPTRTPASPTTPTA